MAITNTLAVLYVLCLCPAGLVGSQKLVSRLQPQHKLQCLVVEDDSEACTKALQVHRDKDFTWLELNRVADTLSSQTNCLEDADTQVKKKKVCKFF